MRLTTGELICFNSMLEPTPIFGFHGSEHAKDEKEVNATKEFLKRDQFLDEVGVPNKKFVLAVELLKRYKEAKAYLMINHYRVALIENKQYIIILNQIEGMWELELISKIQFLTSLIKANAFLTRQNKEQVKKIRFMLQKEWIDSIAKQEIGQFIWIQAINRGNLKWPLIIYEVDGTSYMYESKKERLIEGDTTRMQMELVNILQIENKKGES